MLPRTPHEPKIIWSTPKGYAASHCMNCKAGWTRTGPGGGSSHGMPARPRAGPGRYDGLQQVQGDRGAGRDLSHSTDEAAAGASCRLGDELAAVSGYYAARIAAVKRGTIAARHRRSRARDSERDRPEPCAPCSKGGAQRRGHRRKSEKRRNHPAKPSANAPGERASTFVREIDERRRRRYHSWPAL